MWLSSPHRQPSHLNTRAAHWGEGPALFLQRLRGMRSGARPPTFQKVPGDRKCPLPPRPRAGTNTAGCGGGGLAEFYFLIAVVGGCGGLWWGTGGFMFFGSVKLFAGWFWWSLASGGQQRGVCSLCVVSAAFWWRRGLLRPCFWSWAYATYR